MAEETQEILERKIVELDKDVRSLIEQKKNIKGQINLLKLRDKRKHFNGNKNVLTRISQALNRELEDIQEERIKLSMDSSHISKPLLTELITRHKQWRGIKVDLINFEFDR